MKDSKTIKLLFTIVVLLITISSFSQEETPSGFDDNVVDNQTTPAAPINDYIGVGVLFGLLCASYYLKKRKVNKTH